MVHCGLTGALGGLYIYECPFANMQVVNHKKTPLCAGFLQYVFIL